MRENTKSLNPRQSVAARGALRWTVQNLADETGLATNTILAFEQGRPVRTSTVAEIRAALERHGMKFPDPSSIKWELVAPAE